MNKIPKKIHYCWFGGNPLTEMGQKCLESWRKYFPEYEIIEWNESNYDVNKIQYTKEAYEAKKYAFVSDYARLDILNQYGGIYFDTDVEVIEDMTEIISNGSFMGLESPSEVNIGLGMGCSSNNTLISEILETYRWDRFMLDDGSLNVKTIVTRVTDVLRQHGFIEDNVIQKIGEFTIYPTEYFAPKNPHTGILSLTENSYTIHHFDGSWLTQEMKTLFEEKQWLSRNIKIKFLRILLEKFFVLKKIIMEAVKR